MTTKQSKNSQQKFFWPWLFLGMVLGLVVSWGVLRGDEMGRINLLYMLLLYCVLPVVALIVSLVALVVGQQNGLSKYMLQSQIFNISQNKTFKALRRYNLDKHWLMQQGQLFALAFTLASMLVFLFLLTFTDVSFIWRSTILSPEQLLPVMQWVASPWFFWPGAQPDLELLQASQDFRLSTDMTLSNPGRWWPFVLAVQITYSFLPRLLFYLALEIRLSWYARASQQRASDNAQVNQQKQPATTLKVETISTLPPGIDYLRWDAIPEEAMNELKSIFPELGTELPVPWAEQGSLASHNSQKLVIVKAWEPPLAELADYLKENTGYLLPLNWHAGQFEKIAAIHLDEWRRFAQANDWRLVTLAGEQHE